MLYQLSYASPSCPKDAQPTPENQESVLEFRADTLPLRTFNGTENKVSTPGQRSKPTYAQSEWDRRLPWVFARLVTCGQEVGV